MEDDLDAKIDNLLKAIDDYSEDSVSIVDGFHTLKQEIHYIKDQVKNLENNSKLIKTLSWDVPKK